MDISEIERLNVADRIKESLSAWVDGEASEIEVHQLLRQYGADEAVKQDWLAFQHARAVLRGDSPLNQAQHLALYGNICAAIGLLIPRVVLSQPGPSLQGVWRLRPLLWWRSC